MGSDKGGSSDSSGMAEAMVSAQEADKMYALGEQQLQWSEQVWNQEQPLIDASEQQQIDLSKQEQSSLTQMQDEASQQWQEYLSTYQPLEQQYTQQAENWASPQAIAQARGEAMADVGEQGQAGMNTAAETLRSYGVNPGSPKYASLYTTAQPMLGAAEAAAGTTAAQNLRLQGMGLEAGAINTGRGLVNTTGSLTQSGTGAGSASSGSASGAGQTAFGNLSGTAVGANAATGLFNAGTNAMNTYVNSVNGYNQTQADFQQAAATEMGGFGSAIGGIAGLAFMKSDERDKTDIKREGTDHSGVPLYSFRYKEDPKTYPKVVGPIAQDIAKLDPSRVGAIPGSPKGTLAIMFDDGGAVPGPTITYPSGNSAPVMINRAAPRQTMTSADLQSAAGPPPTPPLPQINRRAEGRAVINDPKAAPFADPRTFQRPNYAYGGMVMGYDDAGEVTAGTDPQMTSTQGGGPTGIPSAPMPPAQAPPGPPSMPTDATPGGGVPAYASPSNGQQTDDVPALLTANEFVIPKDVATWKGHEYFAKQIDAARRGQQQFASRDDIGGEPAPAIPQQPTFVSRPPHMGTTRGAVPGLG